MLYQSLKLTNGIWILAELRIQPGNPNYTVRPLPAGAGRGGQKKPLPFGAILIAASLPAVLSLVQFRFCTEPSPSGLHSSR